MLLPPPQVRRYTPRKTGSANDVLHKVIREHLGELISMTEERGRPLRPYVLHELARLPGLRKTRGRFFLVRVPRLQARPGAPLLVPGQRVASRSMLLRSCPSCGGRRMNQFAANLVDHVLPHVPYRQWVLTLPMPVRFWLAWRPELRTRVLSLVTEAIFDWYREVLHQPRGEGGSVSVWQIACSTLNLNPHIHAVMLDGLFVWDPDRERPVFRCAPKPGRRAMASLVKRIRLAVLELLESEGLASQYMLLRSLEPRPAAYRLEEDWEGW